MTWTKINIFDTINCHCGFLPSHSRRRKKRKVVIVFFNLLASFHKSIIKVVPRELAKLVLFLPHGCTDDVIPKLRACILHWSEWLALLKKYDPYLRENYRGVAEPLSWPLQQFKPIRRCVKVCDLYLLIRLYLIRIMYFWSD